MVLFESESEKDKFSEHFEKSCQYCASRRPRILDSDSLDYKAKEEFTKTGNKKFKGNVHSKSFFGNDFVDWIVESESCDRLKASQVCFILLIFFLVFFLVFFGFLGGGGGGRVFSMHSQKDWTNIFGDWGIVSM